MMTKLVYFFVITMTVVRCSACPIMCTCHNFSQQSDDYLTFYSNSGCGHQDVTAKHQNTQLCLEVSYLNKTAVKNFVECFFHSERNAACQTRLRLINSVLPDNITFTNSNCTEQLDLPKNNITNLNQITINLANLRKLDLSRNLIEQIDETLFINSKNLQSLNLSSNLITAVYPNSFSEMPDLLSLDLSKNNLSLLNDSIFHHSVKLQSFNLSNNRLKTLNEQLFNNLLELQQLDVSCNKLVVVSSAIHLPSLTMLKLNDNENLGPSDESYLFFLTGGCLQEVDASRIGLRQIPTSLTLTVRILRLRGNFINTLRRGDFDSYPLIQTLDVSSNNLSTIEYDALGRLNYLEKLCLKNNSLTELPKSLPENLKLLDVEDNMIQTINGKDFEELHNLEVLLLSGNNISSINSDVGVKLKGLKSLDVSRNGVLNIGTASFEDAKKLQNLRLSHTEIKTSCNISSIFYVNNIVSLDISGSPELAGNFLAENVSYTQFKELQEIDVRNSHISKIPKNIFLQLKKLRRMKVEGNKLNCESVKLLNTWLKKLRPQDNIRIPRCITPPMFSGIAILDYAAGLRYMKELAEEREARSRAASRRRAMMKKFAKQKVKATIRTTTVVTEMQKITSEATTEHSSDSTSRKMLYSSSKTFYEVGELKYNPPSTTEASTMHPNPLPYVNKRSTSHLWSATAILFKIFSISIVILSLIIIVRCSKRKKCNLEVNQQENELLNSGVIELW